MALIRVNRRSAFRMIQDGYVRTVINLEEICWEPVSQYYPETDPGLRVQFTVHPVQNPNRVPPACKLEAGR